MTAWPRLASSMGSPAAEVKRSVGQGFGSNLSDLGSVLSSTGYLPPSTSPRPPVFDQGATSAMSAKFGCVRSVGSDPCRWFVRTLPIQRVPVATKTMFMGLLVFSWPDRMTGVLETSTLAAAARVETTRTEMTPGADGRENPLHISGAAVLLVDACWAGATFWGAITPAIRARCDMSIVSTRDVDITGYVHYCTRKLG